MGLDDGIHLSPAGYRALGDEAFAALSGALLLCPEAEDGCGGSE